MGSIPYGKRSLGAVSYTHLDVYKRQGLFYELGKKKNVLISGDIGCYTLGYADPYNAMDLNLCMGASFSMGHGAAKKFEMFHEDMSCLLYTSRCV